MALLRCEPYEVAASPGAVFDYRRPEPSRADVCGHCGEPMGWPQPAGIVGGDGVPLHHACYERADLERLKRRVADALSPEALAGEAEVTVREELP